MIEAIKSFFADRMDPSKESDTVDRNHRLQLATAALLIEMAQEDSERHSVEFQAIHDGIQETFDLTPDETVEVIELADREAHEATDHFEFTSLINQNFDHQQKLKVVELLWRVCLSDRDMNRYEEQLVRKIAGLLEIEHRDYIAAKLKVQRDMGNSYYGDLDDYE